jgi:hypothetical protein
MALLGISMDLFKLKILLDLLKLNKIKLLWNYFGLMYRKINPYYFKDIKQINLVRNNVKHFLIKMGLI